MSDRQIGPINILDTGIIYRNQKPHLQAIHAMHPTLALVDKEEILAAFDLGQGDQSMDYASYISRSSDGGLTWTDPERIFHDNQERPSTDIIRINRMKDGRIIGFGARLFRDDPNEGLVNIDTWGYVPSELILIESTDDGRTWSLPRTLDVPIKGSTFEICHAIVELTDGRWLAPLSIWRNWDGSMPTPEKAMSFISYDQGKSWPEFMDVMKDDTGTFTYVENSLIQLRDDRLLALAWKFDPDTGNIGSTPYAISNDGTCFGPTKETGFSGQTSKIIQLHDERIFCLYRRHDKPGLWANVSRLDGDKWENLYEAPIWDGAESGMSGKLMAGVEISKLRFGFPNMILLEDGTIFAAFWCWEEWMSNIRWFRIEICD